MPQLLVRDVPAEIVDALKRRAAKAGLSAEAEHRRILEEVLGSSKDEFLARAARQRAETGRLDVDTTEIIRAFRDAR